MMNEAIISLFGFVVTAVGCTETHVESKYLPLVPTVTRELKQVRIVRFFSLKRMFGDPFPGFPVPTHFNLAIYCV